MRIFVDSSCPSPSDIVNGTFVSTGTTAGSIVTYKCHPGHILIGSNVLTCELGGKYDHSAPSCKYVTCPALPTFTNGGFQIVNSSSSEGSPSTGELVLGSIASASCHENYELVNDDMNRIVCTEKGVWDLFPGNSMQMGQWENEIKCQCKGHSTIHYRL